jgi:hypothetical protein
LAASALAISGATVVVAAINAPPVKTSPKYFRRLLVEALLLLLAGGPPAVLMKDGSTDKEFTRPIEERRYENAVTKNGSNDLII